MALIDGPRFSRRAANVALSAGNLTRFHEICDLKIWIVARYVPEGIADTMSIRIKNDHVS
jgi:hypothetical protein